MLIRYNFTMKITDKKLIIFDFDGTLIDSGPDLALSVNHMLKSLNYDTFSQEIIHGWIGNGALTLVKRALLGKVDISEAIDSELFEKALKLLLDFYAKNVCVETTVYPNVEKTLKVLKDNGYVMAIVTNKPFAFIEPILVTLKLDSYFSYYLGGDSLDKKKPNPEPLLHVCKKLSLHVEQSVMIGDSKNDIIAAQNANMQSIGVSYGYNYGEDIGNYNPDVVVDDIYEIVSILKR